MNTQTLTSLQVEFFQLQLGTFSLGEDEGKTLVAREIIDNLEIILHQIEEATNNNNQNPDNTHQGKKIKP